jgi:protein TonB
MHDRVAELLAQRARIGGGAGGGIALSVLLHGSIVGAVVYAAIHASAPQQVSALNIRFAPVAATPQPVSAPPVPAPPAPAAPTLKIPEPVPEAPKPVAKPEPKTVPLSSFGQSTKKGSEKPPAPVPHVAPPIPAPTNGIVGNIDIPAGASGVTALDGDFPYTIYIERMKSLIGQRWFRPQVGGGTVATVSFSIDRDGTIREVKNEISSGNGTFDRAALRAVLEASPLPPLPFAYNGTYLGVHLTFR